LFYKRRTNKPLGGKTHEKIQEARLKELSASTSSPDHITIATQLPTPPDEPVHSSYLGSGNSRLAALLTNLPNDGCPTPRSNARSSAGSSPPPLEDKELPSFEDSQFDSIIHSSLDPLQLASQSFDFPDPSSQASPTSSTEAEPDLEHLDDSSDWEHPQGLFGNSHSHATAVDGSYAWAPETSPDSSSSEGNPFADANKQKGSNDMDTEEISTHHSQSVDTDM
jgi:ubiquitin carboxyl-terminal hydrolase 4/11/15